MPKKEAKKGPRASFDTEAAIMVKRHQSFADCNCRNCSSRLAKPNHTNALGLRGNSMITLEDFFALAEANPDMMQRYYKSVRAVMECLREEAKNSSGWWAKARLRKKQITATY